ncbi:MAG TPA: hypothetical protein VK427_16300 [Kofleriaceae bacterium]|nr:hypothetical protein [Kofleriaceae bacterium]
MTEAARRFGIEHAIVQGPFRQAAYEPSPRSAADLFAAVLA